LGIQRIEQENLGSQSESIKAQLTAVDPTNLTGFVFRHVSRSKALDRKGRQGIAKGAKQNLLMMSRSNFVVWAGFVDGNAAEVFG
jgi:hypothetical protein